MRVHPILAGLLLFTGCVKENPSSEVKLQTFRVTFREGANVGSPEARLPFPVTPVIIPIHIEAIGSDGNPFPFTGKVLLAAEPGEVAGGGDLIDIVGGVAEVDIPVRLSFGNAAIWVQDVDPVQGNSGNFTCNGGCPFGTTCFKKRVCSGPSATMATGVAAPIFFEDPTISDIQTTNDASTSTLVDESLTVSGGTQIVTAIVGNGFYVTDVADPDGRFNSIFIFTFNQPEDVGIGDHLAKFSGIISEFVGSTQVTQPTFDILEENRTDLLPEPRLINPVEVQDLSGLALEPFESGLVEVRNARLPLFFVHCDSPAEGGNGNTDLDTPQERLCADNCFQNPDCSELTNFLSFGQYQVLMEDNQTKIQIVSRDAIRDFDPTDPANLGREIISVIGTLKDVEFADPRWIVQPRFPSDLVLAE